MYTSIYIYVYTSACFYKKIITNFVRFKYFNVEKYFLKSKNYFQKSGIFFFN